MMYDLFRRTVTIPVVALLLGACGSDSSPTAVPETPLDPVNAPRVAVDRFSSTAGMLFVRGAANGLPAANAPIDMDTGPFITTGFGPGGEHIKYYNFDVQPTAPAPIYVLIRQGETSPVPNQLNIVDLIPGQQGYNDFWRVMKVTVPASYVANTITSVEQIRTKGLVVEPTNTIVNCPIVPEGSVARLGGGAHGLTHGWYRNQVVAYFNFDEAGISATPQGLVPLATIFVSFTVNPNQPNGGPPSGFKTEPGSLQTHNVATSLPGPAGYSPLWSVVPFDNNAFPKVHDLASAAAAPNFGAAAIVNCPIVEVKP
jgi:hypothetical protein